MGIFLTHFQGEEEGAQHLQGLAGGLGRPGGAPGDDRGAGRRRAPGQQPPLHGRAGGGVRPEPGRPLPPVGVSGFVRAGAGAAAGGARPAGRPERGRRGGGGGGPPPGGGPGGGRGRAGGGGGGGGSGSASASWDATRKVRSTAPWTASKRATSKAHSGTATGHSIWSTAPAGARRGRRGSGPGGG